MNGRVALLLAAVLAACHGGAGSREPQPTPAGSPAAARSTGASRPRSPADPAPPPAAGPSLYERLGGLDAIRAVVDAFHARIMADERVSAMFRGVDDVELRRLLVEQICQATGGPCRYSGRPMGEAHQGLNVTEEQFNAVVGDLAAALDQFSVPAREKGELLAALGALKGEIVGR